MSGGRWIVGLMFAAAVGLSALSVWYHHQKGRRALEFWPPEVARLIARGEQVHTLRLARASKNPSQGATSGSPALRFAEQELTIVERKDAREARGLTHLRAALLEDANFAWDDPPADCASRWEFALEFSHRGERAAVLFDPQCRRVALSGEARSLSIKPISKGVAKFFHEQFARGARGRAQRAR